MAFQEIVRLVMEQVYERAGDAVYAFYAAYSRTILDVLHFIFSNLFDFILYLTVVLTFVYLGIAIAVQFKKKTAEKPVRDEELPTVTIQIPTYNELAALNCATRCLNFDYPKEKVQIIIGDDSNDKSISAKIDQFAAKHKGRVQVTRRGKNIGFKPGNLNHMLPFTKGDYLVVFDSDFLPEQDFLRRIIAPFVHDKNVHAVQARWRISNFSKNMSSLVGGIIPMFSHRLGLPFLQQINSNGFIAGSAEAVKVKTLKELGGWKSGAFTEDIEYGLRLTRNGKKTVYLDSLPCDCESPFTVKDLCKQQLRWAYGVITALREHLIPILRNKKIPASWKVNPPLLLFGYIATFQFFLLAVLGALSIVTHRPEPIQWGIFLSKTGINFALTSGFLITSIIILNMQEMRRHIPRLVVASYTVGLLVVYNVSKGIFKAIFKRPMHWFMLSKEGNENRL